MWPTPTSISPALGALAVFISVLITQLGAPIPAVPTLILAGTMAAMGKGSLPSAFGAAVAATLLADSLWFFMGRARGRRLLSSLVRFSLSLDTTVRVTRNVFERFGAPILMVAKFLPGLGLISAPLLGTTAIDVSAFLLWDFVGASLWAGTWLIGGAALHAQIEYALVLVWQHGGTIIDAFVLICVAMLAYRWGRRLRFRHWLAQMHISPDQLYAMMKSSAPPLIFDARPSSVRANEAHRIAGAHALDLESPDPLHPELLKRPIVVYCVCPNEATAKRIVNQLHRKNIHHVRALKGGLDEWERRGYPVEPLPSDFDAVAVHNELDDGNEYTVRVSLLK